MRLPLAVNLESRDGQKDPRDDSTVKPRDARIVNGIVELKGERAFVRKRPGIASLGQVDSGVGQLLYNWNGIRAVIDDTISSGTIATIVSAPTQSALTTSNADLQMSAANTGSGAATPRMMFKNRANAWVMNRAGTVSAVTYGGTMGSETFAVVSLTRSGTTATATIASDVPFEAGSSVTIAGATPTDYNGAQTVLTVTPGVYTAARTIPITITRSGTTATATTVSGPHGLSSGTYTIAGANDAAYNGSKSITVTSSTTFTYTVTVTPAATTTWNPSDKNASITLSGGDLTATNSSSSTTDNKAVRGTIGKSSGKWYWEVTMTTIGDNVQVGVARSTESLSNFIGSGTYGWGYNNYGTLWNGGAGAVTKDAFTAGTVIGIALDMDSGEVSFYKNGVLQHTFTGVTGTIYPALSAINGGVFTANFGATSFAHSAPSGFIALNSDSPYSPAAGSITVTDPAVATPATFTFAIGGSVTTPATGTITAQGTGGTVPGIAYLNGYFAVMDTAGRIWNSGLDDPTSWGALDYVDAQNDSSRGMGLAVSRGYLVAFKEWSTEFFYDAANATGSPFSPVDSGIIQTGCANGWSIASIDDLTFWMSQTKAKGRGVHLLSGLEARKISTPDIDRILDDDDLDNVYAFCIKVEGHALYVLTLAPTVSSTDLSGITLAYDATTEMWCEFSTAILGASESAPSETVSSITRVGDVATVTVASNIGINDGHWVTISGATQNEYNGTKQARYLTGTTFEFDVDGEPTTPATTASTITVTYLFARRWPFVSAISFGDSILLLHESTGKIYTLDDALFRDDGNGIDFVIRTPRFDAATLDRKTLASIDVVGNRVVDYAAIRWSDDDYESVSSYRMVDLDSERPQIRRCGAFVRRSFELKHVGNNSPVFEALEIAVRK